MIEIVPFRETHIAPFTAWFNALPNNDIWTADWIRSRSTKDDTYDPELMVTGLEDSEPVGFLLGSVTDDVGWIRAFLVRADRRREGIGTAMFRAVENVFARRNVPHITVGWAPPRYLLPGVDITYTSAIVFLDRLGYQTTRETRVNMDVLLQGQDLSTKGQEAELRLQGIITRRALRQDANEIARLCEMHGHHLWAIETGMALDKVPVPMFVAEREDQIRAFAAHSIVGPIHFGPMLTAPELRGQGIGSVLLKRCLLDWQHMGLKRCEIAWTGPLSFYARAVGATMGRAFWTWHKSLDPDQETA